ncbi:hypothetical protein SK128_016718, partial [Halocaridina rubra]
MTVIANYIIGLRSGILAYYTLTEDVLPENRRTEMEMGKNCPKGDDKRITDHTACADWRKIPNNVTD